MGRSRTLAKSLYLHLNEKWQVNDITFKGKSHRHANPFQVVFGAIYTGPDRQSQTVPGFFNGNDEWVSRLITVHDYEFISRPGELVDFISIQSWRSNLYSLMLQGRAFHADKPVVNIEHGGYEKGPYRTFVGNYTNPETCLVRTYECVFAGVYGSYYWQNTSWNIVVYDPFAEEHDFNPPRFDYYRHLADFFQKYDYNSFKPSIPKITTNSRIGADNLATNGYAMSNGEGTYLMFIPKDSERVNAVLPKPVSGKFKITWFNIFTGEYEEKESRNWSNWMELISPWQYQDSVLIVEEVK
ncbi:DUF5060 domain-containing protein [Lunatibacter salilacus]|uniref:DUF5060 domain-containing protein n=1 Tax=Lunatibacter salilacus TaxID=2483804 RepID=UPI00131B5EF0|nr:DUF5060 domain-containing protein [Lunatibacter salilacus]